jgi:hypothetical protein
MVVVLKVIARALAAAWKASAEFKLIGRAANMVEIVSDRLVPS